jgi:hypothetical protein
VDVKEPQLAVLPMHPPTEVFQCPEESQFYAQCLQKLVLNK